MDLINKEGIPQGDTKEDKKQRKRFIMDFYKIWGTLNPQKQVYNRSLNEFVNVKHISVEETAGQASTRYKSTLAIMFLTEILANAIQKEAPKNSDPTKKNQRGFEKIIIMEYIKSEFGKIKLIVGIQRGTKEKVQYCIAAIEND